MLFRSQILIVEPIVESLKSSFKSLTGSLGGSAGFDIGQNSTGGLLGSIFGSKGLLGGILGLADGGPTDIEEQKAGPVRGPGGPRGDKKLVRLSNGEFVFDAEATKNGGVEHLMALQQYLKRGKLTDLLKPKGMADGGAVQGMNTTVSASSYMPSTQALVAANGNRMASSLKREERSKQIDGLHISFETKVAEDGALQTYVTGVAKNESASSVRTGLSQYDRGLPDRMDQIKRNPKKR